MANAHESPAKILERMLALGEKLFSVPKDAVAAERKARQQKRDANKRVKKKRG